MYISLLPAALLLSLASAQTTSYSLAATTSSACAAQPVLEACLASTEAIAAGCLSTDYSCLCQKWNDVYTCFDQCPNDSRGPSILAQQQTYCNDEAVYGTTTSAAISGPVSSAFSAPTMGSTTAGSGQTTESSGAVRVASSTGTSSSAAATGTAKSGAARDLAVGAGSVLMGVAGMVGAFL